MSEVDYVTCVLFNCEGMRLLIENLSGGSSSKSSWLHLCKVSWEWNKKWLQKSWHTTKKLTAIRYLRNFDVRNRDAPDIAGAFSVAPVKTTQFHTVAAAVCSNECWFRLVSDWYVPVGYPFEVMFLFIDIHVQITNHVIIFASMVVPVTGSWW